MKIIETVKTADAVLTEQIATFLSAQASGDSKAMSAALRTGGIASVVVAKGLTINENPEKYERAQEESETLGKKLPALAASKDMKAKAEGFTRFKSAMRASSQVRKIEGLLSKLSAPAAPRVRRSKAPRIVS